MDTEGRGFITVKDEEKHLKKFLDEELDDQDLLDMMKLADPHDGSILTREHIRQLVAVIGL